MHYICTVCGREFCEEEYIEETGYCDTCDWFDDPVQYDDPDYSGGANHGTFNEAKAQWVRVSKNGTRPLTT